MKGVLKDSQAWWDGESEVRDGVGRNETGGGTNRARCKTLRSALIPVLLDGILSTRAYRVRLVSLGESTVNQT